MWTYCPRPAATFTPTLPHALPRPTVSKRARYSSRSITTPNRSANKVFLRRGLVLVAYDASGLHILKSTKGRLTLRAIFPAPPARPKTKKKKTKKKK